MTTGFKAPGMQALRWPALLLGFALLGGCNTLPSDASSSTDTPSTTSQRPKAGLNAQGEVVDASQVQAGSGRKVKGRDGWEGEITGKPAPGSKFTQLEIGMSMKQVTDMIGPPTDKGTYMTGKAWIPFYMGSDTYREELAYKGQGRLIFAGSAFGFLGNSHLIWIIHSAKESGYR